MAPTVQARDLADAQPRPVGRRQCGPVAQAGNRLQNRKLLSDEVVQQTNPLRQETPPSAAPYRRAVSFNPDLTPSLDQANRAAAPAITPRLDVRELSKVRIAAMTTRSRMPRSGTHRYPSPPGRRGTSPKIRLPIAPIGLALDSAANRVAVLAHQSNPPHERYRGHGPLPFPASRCVSGCPARRSAHTVRSRWRSPALAFCTMPWK